jgi:DNA-binding transcriptional LysR family regulator
MLESLSELRTFVRIVDEGSLSAAARSEGVSVNAISRRLALLERRVGARLLNRTTRRSSPTDDGRRLVERCRRILAEVEQTEADLQPTPGQLRGLVRVGLHPQLIDAPTFRKLGSMLREHEELSLHLLACNTPVDPLAAGLDLVVWGGEVPLQAVVSKLLAVVPWVVAASPDYIKRAGLPKRPADLAGHEILRALRPRSEREWELRDPRGRTETVRVQGRFESDDTATLAMALYAGLGIGLLPRGEVRRATAAGRLVHVLPQWHFQDDRIHLVSPPGRMRLPRVRAVAAIIQAAAESLG